jgi:hypothetical protein
MRDRQGIAAIGAKQTQLELLIVIDRWTRCAHGRFSSRQYKSAPTLPPISLTVNRPVMHVPMGGEVAPVIGAQDVCKADGVRAGCLTAVNFGECLTVGLCVLIGHHP